MDNKKSAIWPMSEEALLVDETLLSTANGYIGIRGNFEEGYKENITTIRGTYINGFYDIADIIYGERAYGFPEEAQKIVNVIDVQGIRLWIEDESFSLFDGKVLNLERTLDIETGIAERKVLWQSPNGHQLEIEIKRMASFEKQELMTIDYKVKSINFAGSIRIESEVCGEVENYTNAGDPRVASGHSKLLKVTEIRTDEDLIIMQAQTGRSGLSMSVAVGHSLKMTHQTVGNSVIATYKGSLHKGQVVRLVKYAIFTDSIRHGHTSALAEAYVREGIEHGIDQWYRAQKDYLNRFWKCARLHVDGDDSVEAALNYSVYQLLASAGKDGYSNIPAKGLSGEGYEGHYFWDTEIYMLPFFTLTNPESARELMLYRHTTLEASKARAIELGHKNGAKIAWRTISGSECSGYFPAGTAQYHINADVAYSYSQYWHLTGDLHFIEEFGVEVMVETARVWLDIGNYNTNGQFVINDVTGPDEYTAIVNNNYYTNAMAKRHLSETVLLLKTVEKANKRQYKHLVKMLDLSNKEIKAMTHAATSMYLPFDERLGIDLQDDSFLQKAPWDFLNTPRDQYPLLLHYHPLTIYRHKVLKQADTVLAHLLLDDRDLWVMKDTFDYYESYTTHDSSLSPCVHAMMAARIGDIDKAYSYFMKTIRLDLDDLHHNTKDGLHIANAGGAYMSLVYGFGGLRIKESEIVLRPALPDKWQGYSFSFFIKGVLVQVEVKEKVRITAASPVMLSIYDRAYEVKDMLEVDLLQ